jgi:HK97 gp10 family phage protein
MSTVIKLDTKVLDDIAAKLDMNTDKVLQSVAFQVEAEAKKRAPRDPQRPPMDMTVPTTGALRNGIHTEKKKPGLYWVADSVIYGIFQELGTSRMPARPFMVPAVEKARQQLADLFKRLFP